MRCKQCEYGLWNVRGRTCPECGSTFDPTEGSFVPNLVEFCCPSCEQPYYGTDQNGLIVPQEFFCVRCGNPCSLKNNMFMRMAPGAKEWDVEGEQIPWARSKSIGPWRALFYTIGWSLFGPSKVGKSLYFSSQVNSILWLCVLSAPMVVMFALYYFVFGYALSPASTSGRYSNFTFDNLLGALGDMGIATLVITGGLMALVAVASLISWGILYIGSRAASYRTVFACWSFASTTVWIMLVPCVGPYCGWLGSLVWGSILAGIMMRFATRRLDVGLVCAVLVPPALVVLTPIVMVFFLIAMSAPFGGAPATQTGPTSTIGAPDDELTPTWEPPPTTPTEP